MAISILNKNNIAIGPLDFRSSKRILTSATATLLRDNAQRNGAKKANVIKAPIAAPKGYSFTHGRMTLDESKITATIIIE